MQCIHVIQHHTTINNEKGLKSSFLFHKIWPVKSETYPSSPNFLLGWMPWIRVASINTSAMTGWCQGAWWGHHSVWPSLLSNAWHCVKSLQLQILRFPSRSKCLVSPSWAMHSASLWLWGASMPGRPDAFEALKHIFTKQPNTKADPWTRPFGECFSPKVCRTTACNDSICCLEGNF